MNATTSCPHNSTAHDGTLLCHWANSPGARGTLNIFWLCISTLGLCVWNAIHPDVPRPNTPWWRVFGKRLWWLFVGLFMPEMLVLVALGQFRQAWDLLVEIDEHNRVPTEFPWWMYLVKSWRPKHGNSGAAVEEGKNKLSPSREHPWTLTHSFYAVMNGFVDDEGNPIPIYQLPRRPELPPDDPKRIAAMSVDGDGPRRIALLLGDPEHIPVDIGDPVDIEDRASKTLLIWRSTTIAMDDVSRRLTLPPGPARRDHSLDIPAVSIGDDEPGRVALLFGNPRRIPDVSVEDIEDRGKAGVLAKSLLVWQLFVFLANCAARWDQSLPLSLLEITTIGHSLCSIIAMLLWWYKPHSIGEATVVGRKGRLQRSLSFGEWRFMLYSWRFMIYSLDEGISKVLQGPSTFEKIDIPTTVTIATIAVLYGLPHLLGLSIQFPTVAEQLCWKIAAVTVIGSPLVVCSIVWMLQSTERFDSMERVEGASLLVLMYILLVVYSMASMFLVGESVRQIFALPVESFREPHLSTYLPSFS